MFLHDNPNLPNPQNSSLCLKNTTLGVCAVTFYAMTRTEKAHWFYRNVLSVKLHTCLPKHSHCKKNPFPILINPIKKIRRHWSRFI